MLREGASPLLAQWAVVLEIALALACVGTAVAFYPIGRHFNPGLALGFLASRVLEGAIIFIGIVSILTIVTVRALPSPEPAAVAAVTALHDWSFLVGPGFFPVANALLFGTLLYRAQLVPRWIPAIGLIGAPLLLASSLGSLFGAVDQISGLAATAAVPIAFWEFSIGVWLITKGVRAHKSVRNEEGFKNVVHPPGFEPGTHWLRVWSPETVADLEAIWASSAIS